MPAVTIDALRLAIRSAGALAAILIVKRAVCVRSAFGAARLAEPDVTVTYGSEDVSDAVAELALPVKRQETDTDAVSPALSCWSPSPVISELVTPAKNGLGVVITGPTARAALTRPAPSRPT